MVYGGDIEFSDQKPVASGEIDVAQFAIDDTLRLGAQVVKREKAALALGANPGQMAVIGAERSRIVKLLQQSLRLRDTHASFHARGLVAHRWLRRPSESGGVESKASEAANVSASMMRELEKAAAEIQREVTDSKKLSNNAEFVYQLLEMAAEDPNFSFKDAKRVLSKYEVEPSAGERAFDALIEYRTNALFSSPVTQAIAAGTSFSLAALHFPRIAIAAALERVLPGLLPKSHTMTGFKAMMEGRRGEARFRCDQD